MKRPGNDVVTAAALEETARRLADARKELASIQEANRREGVLNEHTLHSENAAAQLIERLGKELAHLKGRVRNMGNGTCGSEAPGNSIKDQSILAKQAEHPEVIRIPGKTEKEQ